MSNVINLNYTEPSSWVRIRRRTVYENNWLTIYDDDVVRPDGTPGVYGVVHHRNRSVGVVAMDNQKRVLLIGQSRYTIDRYSWEIPAGGSPQDEDPLVTAHRELREETGCTARKMCLILHAHMSNSVTDEEGFCFLATDLNAGEASPEGTESLKMCWVDFDQAIQSISSGVITDALTILGLQRVALLRTSE